MISFIAGTRCEVPGILAGAPDFVKSSRTSIVSKTELSGSGAVQLARFISKTSRCRREEVLEFLANIPLRWCGLAAYDRRRSLR
jgi:hypothetical protein